MQHVGFLNHLERPDPFGQTIEPCALPAPSMARGPLTALKAYLAGRHDAALIAPDATLESSGVPGQLRGRAAIVGYWDAFTGAIAERELTLETAFEAADRAVIVLRVRGVHAGRLFGQAPTGRRLDLPLVVLGRVDAGQIRHLRVSFDRLTLREQLGAT